MNFEIKGMSPLLSVFDMPTSLAFYRGVLGFEVIHDSGEGDNSGWVMLQAADVTFMLNTAYDDDERPAAPEPSHIAVHRDTCLYFGCPDPDAAYQYLKSNGIELEPPVNAYYGMRQLYFYDPDGYNLCLQWPVDSSEVSQ
jgi:catechol 2,3-dioxygenase-like lactoylglutathione lyase family enzyme